MESRSIVSTPSIVHLCDELLEILRDFKNPANEIDAFCEEVRTLRKFLDLIDRVFKARLSRMAFEEQHFTSVEALLGRCRATLSRLSSILAASGSSTLEAESHKSLEQTNNVIQDPEVLALRVRIGFYILILQMSLQTVKL